MTSHLETPSAPRRGVRRVWIGGAVFALAAAGFGLRGLPWGAVAAAQAPMAAPPPPAVTVSAPL